MGASRRACTIQLGTSEHPGLRAHNIRPNISDAVGVRHSMIILQDLFVAKIFRCEPTGRAYHKKSALVPYF